ncbi:MAG: Isoniazid-inducible protein iniC, partial [Rhodococcus sp. (in: high G+C Gram-positive bacteria)]
TPGSRAIVDEVGATLADVHGFRELRLLGQLRAREVQLAEPETAELSRLIGANGTDVFTRLGLDPDDSTELAQKTAFDAVRTWRSRASHPLFDRFTVRACAIATRSAEGILAELDRD